MIPCVTGACTDKYSMPGNTRVRHVCVCSVIRVAMVSTVVTDIMEMLLVIVMVIMMMSAESCLLRMRLYNQYLSYISLS